MKRFLIACLAVFMAVGFSGAALAAPYVFADADGDMSPDTSINLLVGNTVTLDFYVTGLTEILPLIDLPDPFSDIDTGKLVSMGTNIYFNQDLANGTETFAPPQVSVQSATLSPEWFGVASINPYNSSAATPKERMTHVQFAGGLIDDNENNGLLDQHFLGSILFQCEGEGVSVIDISLPNVGGWLTDNITNISSYIDFDTYDVTVNQGVVPIPGAVWLLGSGLLGLVGIRRRIKS